MLIIAVYRIKIPFIGFYKYDKYHIYKKQQLFILFRINKNRDLLKKVEFFLKQKKIQNKKVRRNNNETKKFLLCNTPTIVKHLNIRLQTNSIFS